MNTAGHFEKVSFQQFDKDWKKNTGREDAEEVYQDLLLPKRATTGSAGYDFFAPADIDLKPGASVLIPTGIRAKMNPGWVLMLFPRSSLGFKYRMQLDNTVGIIDADYYDADNEGHIMCRITNDTHDDKPLHINKGAGMVQGIFVPFGITDDDSAEGKRTYGFGSTDK